MILEVDNWRIYYKVLFLRVVNVLFFFELEENRQIYKKEEEKEILK